MSIKFIWIGHCVANTAYAAEVYGHAALNGYAIVHHALWLISRRL